MGRNVFISFLGTSDYLETHYTFESRYISRPVRFIQEAAVEYLASDWDANDAIMIFMTDSSRKKNWGDNGHGADNERKGLQSCLIDLGLNVPVYDYDIPEGFNEKEIWEIFDIVYSKLNEGDIIYFDVTHAFRSIPLFSTVLFNYARFMKGVSIESVVYGSFETLGTASFVRENIPLEQRYAPVINLTGLLKLQQYTEIASGLDNFGRVSHKEIKEYVDRAEGMEYYDSLSRISKALCDFDNAMTSNNMDVLKNGKYYRQFIIHFNKLKKKPIPKPLWNILERLESSFSGFSLKENSWHNVDAAIRWASKYRMLPLAYTLARESISARLAEIFIDFNPYPNRSFQKFKEYMSALCSVREDNIKSGQLIGALKEFESLTHKLLSTETITRIRYHYNIIADNRNTINHGLSKKSYLVLCQEFENAFENCVAVINSFSKLPADN